MASRAAKLVSVDGGFSPGWGGWVKSVHESTNEGDSAYYDLFKDWRSDFGSGRSLEFRCADRAVFRYRLSDGSSTLSVVLKNVSPSLKDSAP